MRRLGTLCLLFGLAAPALAADEPPAAEEPSIPWYRWLFLGERSKPNPQKKEQAKDQTPAAAAGRDKAPPAPTTKEALAKLLAEEQRVYLQRDAAISRIRQVAAEQGDEATVERAEKLAQELFETYQQKTARLTAGIDAEDRAALERGRDDRPTTAQKPAPRRRTTGGMDR
jgi:molecular chaperone GrpE (heat shock protein)